MIFLTRIALSLVALLAFILPSVVRAELIEVDDPVFGADSVTRDTRTALEWLDLPFSVDRSFVDVSGEFGPGGDFEGWHHATEDEVIGLFESAGIPDINERGTARNVAPGQALIDLVGATDANEIGDHLGHGDDAIAMVQERSFSTSTSILRRSGSLNTFTANDVVVLAASVESGGYNETIRFSTVGHWLVRPAQDQRTPVVIVPGIMGSELTLENDPNDLIWLDAIELALQADDPFLYRLLLKRDGVSPDTRRRCLDDTGRVCDDNPFKCFPALCGPGGANIATRDGIDGLLTVDIPSGFIDSFDYKSYDKLAKSLQGEQGDDGGGYTPNEDLFAFPYDWRLDLQRLAARFRDKVTTWAPSPRDRLDVIAHSMGGLLLREYLRQNPHDHRLRKIIFLGTPQLGAPRAYATLRGFTGTVETFNGQLTNVQDLDTAVILARTFPSVYYLLPGVDFLTHDGEHLEAWDRSLDDLTEHPSIRSPHVRTAMDFHTADFPEIDNVQMTVINGCGQRTLRALDVSDPECPRGRSDPLGDGTVPKVSATALDGVMSLFVEEEHAALPGNDAVQSQIKRLLNGSDEVVPGVLEEDTFSLIPALCKDLEGWRWYSCSPIRVAISDTHGRSVGIENEGNPRESVPGSQYFRSSTNEFGFLRAHTTYNVAVEALSDGFFALNFAKITGARDTVEYEIAFDEVPITEDSTGTMELRPDSKAPSLQMDITSDGIVDFEVEANTSVPPQAYLDVLDTLILQQPLPTGIEQSLRQKIAAALDSLVRREPIPADRQLSALELELEAQSNKLLETDEVELLLRFVRRVRTQL